MNESDYILASQNYARNAKDEYEQSLSYLLTGLDEAKAYDQQAANTRYQNLITQIRQQLPGIQQEFQKNAKAAYINKMQNLQQIDADLNRLGVNTQGFGVTQRLLNESIYGQAYGQVLSDYNDNLRDIADKETNALGDLNAELADLDAAYAKDKLDTLKYIGEQGQNIYNTSYNNYYNDLQYQDKLKQYEDQLKQQEFENQMAQQKYQDAMKQQEWENAFKEKQYQDTLKQQQFENQLAQKEYELKVKQVNASIANSSRSYSSGGGGSKSSSKSSSSGSGNNKVLNTNYCLNPSKFHNNNAFAAYNGMLVVIQQAGGVTKANLSQYLTQKKNEGVFTTSDVNAIKSQFGI